MPQLFPSPRASDLYLDSEADGKEKINRQTMQITLSFGDLMTLDKPNGKESYLSSKHNMDKRSDSDDREEHKVKAKVKRGHGIKNMNMNMTGMTNMTGMGCIKNALIDNVGNVPDSILERLKVGKTTSNFSNL